MDVWLVRVCRKDETDEYMPEYLHYVAWYLKNRLKQRFPGKWSEHFYDEGWTFDLPGVGFELDDTHVYGVVYQTKPMGIGRLAYKTADVKRAYESEKIIDVTPNEQRKGEFEVYKWLVQQYEEKMKEIKRAVEAVLQLCDGAR